MQYVEKNVARKKQESDSSRTERKVGSCFGCQDAVQRTLTKNAKANLTGQYDLYGSNGDLVLKIYENNKQKPESDVKKLMVAKVKELLLNDKRVSLHVTTPENYKLKNIIDIGVNSTQAAAGVSFNKAAITEAFKKAEKDGYIDKFIDETNKSNNCWHVEIKPNAKLLPK